MACSKEFDSQVLSREEIHVHNMKNICVWCFGKSKGHLLNDNHKKLLANIYENFWLVQHLLPGGLCEGCRVKLESQAKKGKERNMGKQPDYDALVAHVQSVVDVPNLRSQGDGPVICPCEMCDRVKMRGMCGKLPPCRFSEQEKRPVGRPPEKPQQDPTPIKTCPLCGVQILPGHRHPCDRASKIENLRQTLSPRTIGMLAKDYIADKIAEAKKAGKDYIALQGEHGKPMMVAIQGQKRAVITKEIISKYRAQFGMSKSKALATAKFFKDVTMGKLELEPYLKEFIFKSDTCISEFFAMKTMELLGYDEEEDDSVPLNSKKTLKTVKREVFYCTDVPALAAFLHQERGIDAEDSIIKIGLDGGRGFFKVLLSIHSKSEYQLEEDMSQLNSPRKKKLKKKKKKATKEFLNNGVKKVFILALVQDIPEKYENVQKIMELLDIDELKHSFSVDLKLQNVMCGMQSHGSTHPCVYCEGSKPWEEPSNPRTMGNLRKHYESFENAPPSKKIPKNFKNVVHPPLFNDADHVEILDVMPLAELHLMLGITNTLLFKLNSLLTADGKKDFVSSILSCLSQNCIAS